MTQFPGADGPWGPESGRDDAGFIARLRELLEDFPIRATEQFSPNGTATEARCTQTKINDDKYLQVVSSGVPVAIVFDRAQLMAGNCVVDCNTGWVLFGTAPAAGTNTLIVYKHKVRWRDSAMLQALYGGLLFLYPKRYREAVSDAITMQTNTWDYTLPPLFNSPDVWITQVGVREIPSSVNRFRPISSWQKYGTTLRLPRSQYYSPGSTVEVRYTSPYRSLSDVDDIAVECVIYYAASQLLGFKEAPRTNIANQTAATDSSAQPPGFAQQTAAWYYARAREMRDGIARAIPMARARSTLDT